MKMSYSFPIKSLIWFSFALLLFYLSGCSSTTAGVHTGGGPVVVKSGPSPHAPAYGYRAKHTYRYYPDAYVYYDVTRKVYFYLEKGEWIMAVSFPNHLSVNLSEYVMIETENDKPYTEYDKHKQKYPPGQLKKKEKWATKR
jgi:hypothetical protein